MPRLRTSIINRSLVAREGIERTLNDSGQIEVVSHHPDVQEALLHLGHLCPHAIIIDYPDSNNCRGIIAVREFRNDISIIVSGISMNIECIVSCAGAGASGYIRSEASGDEWVDAVVGATSGAITDAEVAGLLNRYVATHVDKTYEPSLESTTIDSWRVPEPIERAASRVGLTPRERQILALIDDGLSTKRIAKRLKVQPNTVKTHISAILAKYNVHRRSEAAAIFRKSNEPGISHDHGARRS